MNAQVVIAVSSLVVGMFCVIFFYLAGQEGFDENSVFWGTFEIEGDDMAVKFAQDGGKSMLTTFGDGSSEYLTEIDGELVHFDFDASGALTNCESNTNVDFIQVNGFFTETVDGVIVVGEQVPEGEAVTVSYSFTEGAAAADFFPATPSYDDCKNVAGSRRRLAAASEEVAVNVDRRLSAQSWMAKDVYNRCDVEVGGWSMLGGSACAIIDEDNCRFSFRGSNDASDWFSNAIGAFSSSRRGPANRKLHTGFVKEFERLQPHLDSKIKNCGHRAQFIGHSLGGAISSVAFSWYGYGTTFTWGQPKVYDDNVGCVEGGGIRMYNENDPVPGNLFGAMYTYHHGKHGTELYRTSSCQSRNWWGRCTRYGYGPWQKRGRGCNDHSGTWDTDIGAHSMDTYHANS
jgi:hypothetical protein